jgi:hypothetical protein
METKFYKINKIPFSRLGFQPLSRWFCGLPKIHAGFAGFGWGSILEPLKPRQNPEIVRFCGSVSKLNVSKLNVSKLNSSFLGFRSVGRCAPNLIIFFSRKTAENNFQTFLREWRLSWR